MAGKMFLGGKFRRIIDAEARLIDFQTSLAEAPGLKGDTGRRICAGSAEFGFQGVRMSIDNAVFEELTSPGANRIWQLRVPLPGGEYINFFRDFNATMDPLVLSAFVTAVERGLTAWLATRQDAVVRRPASPLAYSAAATVGAERRVS